MKKIFIIGGGIAALEAAKSARSTQRDALIVLISAENFLPYSRPMLTKQLMGKVTAQDLAVESAAWYDEKDIVVLTGRTVTAIDPVGKTLMAGGTPFHWDSLILATGASCFVPPIPGADGANVVAVRTFDDVARVREIAKTAKNAAVIGGGVLGLEAAWELKKAGLEVTVLEMAPSLMGRQLDESSGEQLKIIASKSGVVIRTGVNVEAIEGDGHVTGVRLKTGEVVEAGMVIVSAGIRANVGLAKEMGLEVKKGVVVNEWMETSVPGIYACGDCAEYHDTNYGIWPEAVEQGKTAGANAAGDSLEYVPVPAALTFHGMNTALFAAGDNGRNPNLYYKTVEFRDMGKEQYRKYYFLNNRLCGVILIGDVSRMAEMTQALEEHVQYQELKL